MARETTFSFSFPGQLRYCSIDPLGLHIVVLLAGRSTVYVHRRTLENWESVGTQLLGHSGNAIKAAWAHPDHGPLFATCAEDKTIKIWEVGRDSRGQSSWRLQSTLTPHRELATDLQFLDDSQNLVLACCTVAGEVVVYTCEDRAALLWRVGSRFPLGAPGTAVSWGPDLERRQIAAADGKTQGKVRIWQANGAVWTAGSTSVVSKEPVTCLAWGRVVGRRCCFLAVGYSSGKLEIYTLQPQEERLGEDTLSVVCEGERQAVTRLDWDPLSTYLSASWADGHVDVFKRTLARTWKSAVNRR